MDLKKFTIYRKSLLRHGIPVNGTETPILRYGAFNGQRFALFAERFNGVYADLAGFAGREHIFGQLEKHPLGLIALQPVEVGNVFGAFAGLINAVGVFPGGFNEIILHHIVVSGGVKNGVDKAVIVTPNQFAVGRKYRCLGGFGAFFDGVFGVCRIVGQLEAPDFIGLDFAAIFHIVSSWASEKLSLSVFFLDSGMVTSIA